MHANTLCLAQTRRLPEQLKMSNMSSFTYLDSPTKASALLLITAVCTIFVFHADASLLNPDLIEKELKAFANHALGVDEMQVRARVSLKFFLNAIKLLPILCAKERFILGKFYFRM